MTAVLAPRDLHFRTSQSEGHARDDSLTKLAKTAVNYEAAA